MTKTVLRRTFEIAKGRFGPILGASLAPWCAIAIATFFLLVPAMSILGGPEPAAPSTTVVRSSDATTGPPGTVTTPATPATPAASAGPVTDQASQSAAPTGKLVMALVMALLWYAFVVAASGFALLAGAAAANGSGVRDAFGVAKAGFVPLSVQWLLITWRPAALGLVSVVLLVIIGPLALLGLFAAALWAIPMAAYCMVSTGAVADGDRSRRPALTRAATDGRRLDVFVAYFVTALVAGLVQIVPVLGSLCYVVLLAALPVALWEEVGGSQTGPAGGSGDPATDPAANLSGYDGARPHFATTDGQTPQVAGALPAAVSATPVPAAAPAAAAPSPPGAPMQGPRWEGTAAPNAPFGQWLQMAVAGRAALQVAWHGEHPPHVHLADQQGAWRDADSQPSPQDATVWLSLPAGWTWVSFTTRGSEPQPLRVVTWLEAQAAVGTAASAVA